MELKITDLMDEYMDEVFPVSTFPVPENRKIKEATMKRIKKRNIRPLRIGLIAAACIVLLTGVVFGISYAKSTLFLEDQWNTFASENMTPEQVEYVEERSAEIGESITDQGVAVTVDSVTCTTDTAYLLYKIEFDPEQYDFDNIVGCSELSTVYVENGDFTGGCSDRSGNSEKVDGVIYLSRAYQFDKLPEGAYLGDGQTMMHVEMNEIWVAYQDEEIPNIVGAWKFEFLLPETEAAEPVVSDTVVSFNDGTELTVTEIEVDEDGCSFVVCADNYEYFFCDSGMAELARAAQPDMLQITVEAKLTDGTVIPSSGAEAGYDEALDAEVWDIRWSAPVDPETVESLVFSDGINATYIRLK